MLELARQEQGEGSGPFNLAIVVHTAVEKLPGHFGRGKLGGGVDLLGRKAVRERSGGG